MGVAVRDITPTPDIFFRNWGAAVRNRADGVHRPFQAVVLSMASQAGDEPLIIAGVDGGWWQDAADERFVRQGVLDALGIADERLIINLSHTHAGPALVRAKADEPGGEHIEPYLRQMQQALIEAALEAIAKARPAELRWAIGRCELAADRGFRDPDRNRFVTGFVPGVPADDTVLVGAVRALDGEVLGSIVNYACHPTTLAWDNTLLSPDYIGAMRAVVSSGTDEAPCMFLLGACGNLAPAHQYVGDVAVADRHGERLGFAALSALRSMPSVATDLAFDRLVESGAPLAVWTEAPSPLAPSSIEAREQVLMLPIKVDYPTTAAIEAGLRNATEGFEIERWRRRAALRRSLGDAPDYPFHVWLWRFGSTLFVGWPGEAWSSIQSALRAEFPEFAVVVMNVVNGTIGYLPPAELYREDMYEVWQTPLQAGCLEVLHQEVGMAFAEMSQRNYLSNGGATR
jgi:hypothetical protein